MKIYYFILYISVFLAAMGQVLLKLGSEKNGFNLFMIQLNIWVVMGLGAMTLSAFLSLRGFSVVPLRDMAFILPTVYILVPVFAKFILKERFGKKTFIGSLILLSGIVLFNIPITVIF